jgi:hypothetical protein
MDGEAYCGGFFCEKHKTFQVCLKCVRKCPECMGEGCDQDGEPCNRCDSFGELGHEEPKPANPDASPSPANQAQLDRIAAKAAR